MACKWNVAAISLFLLLHMLKSFVYQHFPEMLIPLKSRNHFNFSAPTKCRFLFKPIILEYSCIHVNKVSHYNMTYSQSNVNGKMAFG